MKNNICFIHVGNTYSKEDILMQLCVEGECLLVLDDVGLRSKKLNSDYVSIYSLSLTEIVKKIEKYLEENGIKDFYFFTLAEGSVDLLNKILKKFNLSPVSTLDSRLRDKFLNRKRLEEFGVKIATLHHAVDLLSIPLFSNDEYPLVVKPVESMESRGVSIVKNQAELQEACFKIFTGNKTIIDVDHGQIILENIYEQTPGVLIESKLEGEKISIEVLVINGKVIFQNITRKYDYDNSFFYERADFIDSSNSQELKRSLEHFVNVIISANKIDSSILHIEAFLDPETNKLGLIEINYRLGGGHIHELIKRKFNIDILKEFLSLGLNKAKGTQNVLVINEDDRIWVSFDFITTMSGNISIKALSFNNAKIDWLYSTEEKVYKFESSNFYKVGTVIFSVENSKELNDSLAILHDQENKFFEILSSEKLADGVKSEKEREVYSSIDKVTKRIFGLSALVFTSLVLFYFLDIYHSQIDFLTDTLSKTLSASIVNGEVYAISNTVNNFKSQKWFNKIVVTDEDWKVVYSNQGADSNNYLYRKYIKKSDFPNAVEIRTNGINVGWLLYEVSYSEFVYALILYVVGFILISFLIYYFVIRVRLVNRINAVNKTVNSLVGVANELQRDIENIHDGNSTFHLEKYKKILHDDGGDILVKQLKEGVFKLVVLVPAMRNLLFQKQELSTMLQKSLEAAVESRAKIKIGELASQVAHDIRSPLSALTMIAGSLDHVPEDKRIVIRNAINRINDIANTLLKKSKEQSMNFDIGAKTDTILQCELIAPIVDMLVSEKRIEFRDQSNIEIQENLNNSYGLFSKVDSKELKRILSNLINNSVEAFSGGGKIIISVFLSNGSIAIQVKDNGKGIPKNILERLGEQKISYGKEGTDSGSGIGIYHANTTIESFGGKFSIESTENVGTTITIMLPIAKTPSWFVEKILLNTSMHITSIDDDLSIHQIWKERFDEFKINDFGIEHSIFTSGAEFEKLMNNKNANQIFLVDYELLNQKMTGLDLIENLGIANQSILVTSRYEEENIRERCKKLGVKLIPKAMAALVPLEMRNNVLDYDLVLLDDDELVRMTWKMKAERKGKKILILSHPSDLWGSIEGLDLNTKFYIDVHLGENVSGVDICKKLFDAGYSNLFLATGYQKEEFENVSWIKGVVGKSPEIF